jgi:tight adherence protein D
MVFSKKMLVIGSVLFILTGCTSMTGFHASSGNTQVQEDIYLKSRNYTGLINLYRSSLKQKDDPKIRYKLSKYYYQAGDYKSSLYYLQPLLKNPDQTIYTLQAQNMISLGDYPQAIRVTQQMLSRDNKYAEAYNLKGVALALSGKYSEANAAIQQARDMFIADDVAINNMAMIALLDQRYQDAVGLLLPQYLRGRKQERMIHNLVVGLVKVGDARYAKQIVRAESLSDYPDELIDSLISLGPIKNEVL